MTTNELFEKMRTQTVYLKYEFEDVVFKCIPNGGCYTKFKGDKEFKTKEGSKLLTDAFLDPVEITKKEYDEFK